MAVPVARLSIGLISVHNWQFETHRFETPAVRLGSWPKSTMGESRLLYTHMYDFDSAVRPGSLSTRTGVTSYCTTSEASNTSRSRLISGCARQLRERLAQVRLRFS
jgi:hypothetical protein